MSVLALDLSTKTGWALFDENNVLVDYGVLVAKNKVSDLRTLPLELSSSIKCNR